MTWAGRCAQLIAKSVKSRTRSTRIGLFRLGESDQIAAKSFKASEFGCIALPLDNNNTILTVDGLVGRSQLEALQRVSDGGWAAVELRLFDVASTGDEDSVGALGAEGVSRPEAAAASHDGSHDDSDDDADHADSASLKITHWAR